MRNYRFTILERQDLLLHYLEPTLFYIVLVVLGQLPPRKVAPQT